LRDLLRQDLGNVWLRERPDKPGVATVRCVDDHHQRRLAMRLTDLQHGHHELTHEHFEPSSAAPARRRRGAAHRH